MSGGGGGTRAGKGIGLEGASSPIFSALVFFLFSGFILAAKIKSLKTSPRASLHNKPVM